MLIKNVGKNPFVVQVGKKPAEGKPAPAKHVLPGSLVEVPDDYGSKLLSHYPDDFCVPPEVKVAPKKMEDPHKEEKPSKK